MSRRARVAGLLRIGRGRSVGAAALVAGLVPLAGAGCRPLPDDPQAVLATYDGGSITRDELDRYIEESVPVGDRRPRSARWLETKTRELAVREIVLTRAAFDDEIEAIGERAAAAVLEAAMRERLGWSEIDVDDAEVRSRFEQRPEEHLRQERLRLQHIFVRSDGDGGPAAASARIEGVRRMAIAGEDFAELARRFSDSADAASGGWIVLDRSSRAAPAFLEAVARLDEGEISPVIETTSGFHLARIDTRVPAVRTSFEEARPEIVERLRAERLAEMEGAYLRRHAGRYGLERRYDGLSDPDADRETVLFLLGDEAYTLGDLLSEMPVSLRAQLYGGYYDTIERWLDGEALRRILLREARLVEVEAPELAARASRAAARAQTDALLERRLERWAAATDERLLRRHYDSARARYRTPRLRSATWVRCVPKAGVSLWSTLREAERVRAAIASGTELRAAIQSMPDATAAVQWRAMEDLDDEELLARVQAQGRGRQLVEGLGVGEISRPYLAQAYDPESGQYLTTGVGFVRIDREIPMRQLGFEEARSRVVRSYLALHRERAIAAVSEELLSQADLRMTTR